MKGYVQDIESIANGSHDFRRVLYNARHCQLVVMSLKPQEDIGAEAHKLDGVWTAGSAVIIPAGARQNISNTGSEPLKLYTLCATPNHRDEVVHHTRADAEADTEHFDGKASA